MIPYHADVPMRRWPWANWVIIGVTILTSVTNSYIARDLFPPQVLLWSPNTQEFVGKIEDKLAKLRVEEERKQEVRESLASLRFMPHQLLTHTLFHAGFWHLFGNMVFLFVFGNAICAKLNDILYILFYALFAAISGVAWYMRPGEGVVLLGASGAVMGVAGMFAVLYPLNEISMFTLFVYRPITFSLSAVWVLSGYFVLDLLGFLGPADGISHVSHLAGMLAGAGIAGLLVLMGMLKPGRGEKTLLEIAGLKVEREEPYQRLSSKPRIEGTVVPLRIPDTRTVRAAPPGVTPGRSAAARTKAVPPAALRPQRPVSRGPSAPVDDLPAIELEPLGPSENRQPEGPPSTDADAEPPRGTIRLDE